MPALFAKNHTPLQHFSLYSLTKPTNKLFGIIKTHFQTDLFFFFTR